MRASLERHQGAGHLPSASRSAGDGDPGMAGASMPLILCADDFGLAPGVDEAIVRLADAGRLSATSCMALMPGWRAAAPRLRELAARCDIGLHLTLTDHRPLGRMPGLAPAGSLPPVGRLLAAAYTCRLDRQEGAAELRRQWDAFTQAHGRLPDFVDGHQHVHLLPGVREAVLALLLECPPGARPWLRVCWEPPAHILGRHVAAGKAMLLAALSLPLRRAVRRLGLAANDSFRGIHAFAPDGDFASMFPRFLQGKARRPLIMCHPGLVDDALRAVDPVVEPRAGEYAYLASDRFTHDLAAAGWRLARFRDFAAG